MSMFMSDAAVASGQVFLQGELEKLHADINAPLSNFTWSRDIPFDMGGGAVENISNMYADFATSGANEDGIVGGATNVIPIIQANFSKDLTPVFPWMNNLRITFLDLMKMMTAGRSIQPILEEGLQLNWNKTLDKNVYTGLPTMGTTGLLNNAGVTSASVIDSASNPNSVSGAAKKLWINKTPNEILNDINSFINAGWAAAQYSGSDIFNTLLIPPAQFNYLVSTINSSAGVQSLMTYLLENNAARAQGVDLKILPCRQCIGAGASGVDRMVGYINRKDRVTFDITIPLTKGLYEASVSQAAYLTNYYAFFSAVQIKYTQTIRYADGI